MLNLNCIICAELFTSSDNVFVTPCGHMFHKKCLDQWFVRSKTCPQCRHKCLEKNTIRVFFNQTNADLDQSSIGCIQERLDNMTLQLRLKETELKKSQEEVQKLSSSQKKNMKTIVALEKKMEANKFLVQSYEEQLKLERQENKTLKNFSAENERLKAELAVMRSASSVLVSTIEESEKMLETESDVRKLTAWVSTLKRELEHCKNKKNYIQEQLRKTRDDFRKETESKKILEERLKELNSELYKLTPKSFESVPVNVTTKRQPTSPINDISDLLDEQGHNKSIELKQNSSPFLNIKSCSMGLMPLAPLKRATGIFAAKSNIIPLKNENMSIKKKARLDVPLLVASKSVPLGVGLGADEQDSPIISKTHDLHRQYVPQSTETVDELTISKTTSFNHRLKAGKLRNFSINMKKVNLNKPN